MQSVCENLRTSIKHKEDYDKKIMELRTLVGENDNKPSTDRSNTDTTASEQEQVIEPMELVGLPTISEDRPANMPRQSLPVRVDTRAIPKQPATALPVLPRLTLGGQPLIYMSTRKDGMQIYQCQNGHIHGYTRGENLKCKTCSKTGLVASLREYLEKVFEVPFTIRDDGISLFNPQLKLAVNGPLEGYLCIEANTTKFLQYKLRVHRDKFPPHVQAKLIPLRIHK